MVAHESWGLGAQFESDIFHHTKLILSSEYKAILSMPQRTSLIQYRRYNGELRVAEFSPKMV